MSEKKLVCHGALCKCQFGMTPDSLVVLSQQKVYINDSAGSQKLVATDKELGLPFQAKTFGQCKLQPTTGGFLPCVPSITGWTGFFEKTQIKSNQGYPLIEDSKATCAIAGSPCVEITFHGQTAAPSSQNVDNADEEVLAQVLPQVNINEIKYPSPYDGINVSSDENSNQHNSSQEEEEEKEIAVAVSVVKDTFVPLGIAAFNGDEENDSLKFNIEVKDNDAERMLIEIRKNGSTHFSEEITEGEFLSVGKREWKWDGFSNSENLNTKELRENEFDIKVTVWLEGNEQSDTKKIGKFKRDEVKWVDVDIQKNIKQILVTLRVDLKDGGEHGTEVDCREMGASRNAPVVKKCPWDNIPSNVLTNSIHTPIKKRNRTYLDLENLAIKGLIYYWSRDSSHTVAKNVNIKGKSFELTLNVVNTTKDTMDDISLVYNTNRSWMRSGNPGTVDGLISAVGNLVSREAVCYNVGFIKYSNGWSFQKPSKEDIDFSETAAHEIGHTILKAFGGTGYSYGHKGSTGVVTQSKNKNTTNYPKSGEIDLMKYFKNWIPYSDRKRIAAAEKDVLGLIWLAKLKMK